MEVRGVNLIGYRFSREGETTFCAFDPVLNQELPTIFHEATHAERREALSLATKAFPVFSIMEPALRTEFLHAIADRLQQETTILCHYFCTETGLSHKRAVSELARTCFQLRSYGDAVREGKVLNATIETGDPDRIPSPRPDLRKVNVAIGPVAVFGAGNFPFAYSTPGGDTASALAAGCPVIVKGHYMHPHTGELTALVIAETAKQLGLPEGVFSFLHGKSHEAGAQLAGDDDIKAVGFTGSYDGGMAMHHIGLSQNLRADVIPVFAEMGSLNPVVILPQAIRESGPEIVDKIAASISNDAGQFCTKPGFIFLLRSPESEKWVADLTVVLMEVEPRCMLHPDIYQRYLKGKEEQLVGAKILLSEHVDRPNFIRPTLLEITGWQFISEGQRKSEVFGAFSYVVMCEDEAELRRCFEMTDGHLTGSLFAASTEKDLAERLLPFMREKVGRLIMNGVPTGVEVSPAMHHGGPFPASTDSRFTSVGPDAIIRFMRPVCYQNFPDYLLPQTLQQDNPFRILRFVNGSWRV